MSSSHMGLITCLTPYVRPGSTGIMLPVRSLPSPISLPELSVCAVHAAIGGRARAGAL